MIVLALIGAKALYLLFLWLVSAAAAAWLSEHKGYGERLGLTFGLILSVAGLVVVLLLPGRPGSRWIEGAAPPDYPLRLEVEYPERLNRLSTLLRGALVIPHLLALAFVWLAALLAQVVAGFAVLFTGQYPRSLFNLQVGTLRWTARVSAYGLLLTDRYPPFSFTEEKRYPVTVEVDYPPEIAWWRPLVNWILVIPVWLATMVLQYVISLLAIEAWFAILFTGRYPRGLFVNITTGLRWTLRQNAFQLWLTEQHPPVVWA